MGIDIISFVGSGDAYTTLLLSFGSRLIFHFGFFACFSKNIARDATKEIINIFWDYIISATSMIMFQVFSTFYKPLTHLFLACFFLPTNCRLLSEIVEYPTQVPSTCWCGSHFYGEGRGPVGCSCGTAFRGEGGWCTIAQRCRLMFPSQ